MMLGNDRDLSDNILESTHFEHRHDHYHYLIEVYLESTHVVFSKVVLDTFLGSCFFSVILLFHVLIFILQF